MREIVTERLSFTCRDRTKRVLTVHRPDGPARGGVLLAHCFAMADERYALTRLTRGLAEAGYGVLRWDFTGLGDVPNAADPHATSAADLTRAASLLSQRECHDIAFVGHAVAGIATLLAVQTARDAGSVVLIGAPATRASAKRMLDSARAMTPAITGPNGHTFPVSAELLDEYAEYESARSLADLGHPFLVLHGLDDEVVPIDEGEKLFALASQPKAFVPIVGGDHLMTTPAAGEQLLRVILDWLHRMRAPRPSR